MVYFLNSNQFNMAAIYLQFSFARYVFFFSANPMFPYKPWFDYDEGPMKLLLKVSALFVSEAVV